MKNIKVVKMPGVMKDVVLEGEVTVKDVLEVAEIDAVGFAIKVNGIDEELGSLVEDGDRVVLSKMIKGNSGAEVKVVKMPGVMKDIFVEHGTTVEQVLELADMSSEGHSIKINGIDSDLNATVEDGDRVVLSKMIKGNR